MVNISVHLCSRTKELIVNGFLGNTWTNFDISLVGLLGALVRLLNWIVKLMFPYGSGSIIELGKGL